MKLEYASSFHNSALIEDSLGYLGGHLLFNHHGISRTVLFHKLNEHRALLIFIIAVHRKVLGASAPCRGGRRMKSEWRVWYDDFHLLDFSAIFF